MYLTRNSLPLGFSVRFTLWQLCLLLGLSGASILPAADDTWVPTAGGTYSWDDPANWISGTQFPNGIDNVANVDIDIAGTQTLELNQAITLGTLNLGDSNSSSSFNLNAGTAGSLIFDVSTGNALLARTGALGVTDTINANVTLNDDLTIRYLWSSSSGGIRFNGLVSGTGGINITSAGLPTSGTSGVSQFVDLTRTDNTYTGDTIISNGILIYRGDVLVSTDGALGNSANAVFLTSPDSITSSSAQNFQNTTTTELRLQATDDTTNYTFARDLDFSTGVGDGTAGRTRFTITGDGSGGVNTNTVTFTGTVTLGSNGRRMEFYANRQGQTIYFTGAINSGTGSQSTIYFGPSSPGSVGVDGATNGTYRFSDMARTYTNSQNLTNGTFIIEGSVPASGPSPIGTQGVSLGDGNGGNIFSSNTDGANRSIFLETPGTSYERTLSPSGGTGQNFATTNASNQARYGNSGSVNMMNGYQFGGLNTSGTITFSGNISPGTVNVPVTGTATGAGGTNVIQAVHNIALIATTGGTVEFTGSISGSTAPTLGTSTPGTTSGGNTTRITINQFRNHANLDANFDGFADANADQLVGTATQGTVVFKGTNSYSESTEILGGTLRLDYDTNNTTKLSDTGALILSGGNLELANGSHTEIVGSTILNSATLIRQISGSSVLQMGEITRNSGGTLDFSAENIASTDTLNDASGILGTWATINGTDWAMNSTNAANGLITAYAGYTDVTRLGPSTITDVATNNVRIIDGGTSGNITLGSTLTTINSLNLQASAGPSIIEIGAGETLNIVTGGILLQSGAGALTIGTVPNDGILTAGGTVGTGAEIVITHNSANTLTINSAITDNGAGVVELTLIGSGSTILTGTNTYTGDTLLSSGTLQIGDGGTTGSLSPMGSLTNNGELIFNRSDTLTQGTDFANAISGTGGVTQAGSGTLILASGNTFTGKTVVNAGTLSIDSQSALGSNPESFSSDQLTLDGGTLQTTATFSLDDSNRGITIGASGGTFDVALNTTTSIGASNIISGTGDLTKLGEGRLTINGDNTYDGVTYITEGIIQINSNNGLGSTVGETVIYSTGSVTTAGGPLGGQLMLNGDITIAENITVEGTGDGPNYQKAIVSNSGTNTIDGVITLTGTRTFRIGAYSGVLNIGLIQRSTSSGGSIVLDPSIGAVLNVNQAIDNNGGALTIHAGGLVVLNASNNDIGDARTQNRSLLKVGATDALSTTRYVQIGNSNGNTSTGSGNDIGTLILGGVDQTINGLNAYANGGSNSTTTDNRLITNDTAATTSTLTIGNNNGNGSFDGVIEDGLGIMAITKTGSGTQTFTGTVANTYTGATLVNGGTLVLAKDVGITAIEGDLTIGDGTGNDIVGLTSSDQISDSSVVSFLGTGSNAGILRLNNESETLGGLSSSDGAGIVENDNSSAGVSILTTNVASGTQTYSGILRDHDGSASGLLSFVKEGTGTQVLSGTNTYTGTTTVNMGVLQIGVSGAGTSGTGDVLLNSGGTLTGTGLIQSSSFSALSGSTLRAGDGILDSDHGTLSFNSSGVGIYDFQSGSSIVLDISSPTLNDPTFGGNDIGTPGYDSYLSGITGVGNHDQLVFDGTAGSILNFNGDLEVVSSGYTAQYGDIFYLLDWASAIGTTFDAAYSTNNYRDGSADNGSQFNLPDISGSGLFWDASNFTTSGILVVVPEPSRVLLLGLGLLSLGLRRKRAFC